MIGGVARANGQRAVGTDIDVRSVDLVDGYLARAARPIRKDALRIAERADDQCHVIAEPLIQLPGRLGCPGGQADLERRRARLAWSRAWPPGQWSRALSTETCQADASSSLGQHRKTGPPLSPLSQALSLLFLARTSPHMSISSITVQKGLESRTTKLFTSPEEPPETDTLKPLPTVGLADHSPSGSPCFCQYGPWRAILSSRFTSLAQLCSTGLAVVAEVQFYCSCLAVDADLLS